LVVEFAPAVHCFRFENWHRTVKPSITSVGGMRGLDTGIEHIALGYRPVVVIPFDLPMTYIWSTPRACESGTRPKPDRSVCTCPARCQTGVRFLAECRYLQPMAETIRAEPSWSEEVTCRMVGGFGFSRSAESARCASGMHTGRGCVCVHDQPERR
jgi:hypothetical protein